MNVLNGGCLTRFCRILYWTYPCCKERGASAHLINLDRNRQKRTPLETKPAKLYIKPECFGKHQVLSILSSCTQVRFKDYPKLHSDYPLPNFDLYRKKAYRDVRKQKWGMGDDKKGYTYVVGLFGLMCAAYSLKTNLIHYAMYMSAPADVLALASIEVEIGKVAPGVCLSLKWRGKPLFIKHRTASEIEKEAMTPMSALKDPETPEQRMTDSKWLIVIGICTHLGCVPIPNSGDFVGGFYCPCHGSHYDNVGRARKGPAPTNLEVPPYKFITESLIQVG